MARVLLGMSGGVDSSVAAALVNKAIGKNLYCIHVNHGLLRENESNEVLTLMDETLKLSKVSSIFISSK